MPFITSQDLKFLQMICHQYKCIFVHIPKNAGQSIEHVFLDLLGLNWETRAPLLLRYNDRPEIGPPRLAHLKADEYVRYRYLSQEFFDQYFKFAFVRNPWSRMVSIYKYLGFDKKYDFKTFLMGEFRNRILKDKYWFVGPQSNFLYSDNGERLVNYIGRFEALQSGFNEVCKEIGLPPTRLPHVNESKGHAAVSHSSPKRAAMRFWRKASARSIPSFARYQEYYDKDTTRVVEDIYERDIALFGYEFE